MKTLESKTKQHVLPGQGDPGHRGREKPDKPLVKKV